MIYLRQPKKKQRSRRVDRDPENVEEEITGYNLRADGDEEVAKFLYRR